MSEEANLFAQQEANRRRSRWLVIGFILFFAWVGFGGDLAWFLLTADAPPNAYHHVIPFIGIFSTLAAGGICWYSWRHGPEKVLWATGAWELVEPATPEQKQLVNVVEEMAIASGVPRPRIWIVPDTDPNAFATGRDAATASIAVTEGLLGKLSRDELQGVVAHEMAHVRNLDVRLMTLLAGMVGAIALMSDGMGRMLGRGGRVAGRLGSGAGGEAGQREREESARAGDPGALAAHAAGGADHLAAARDGGEPETGIPGRRHRRPADPEPDGAGQRPGEARGGHRTHSGDYPGRGASLHRGSGPGGPGEQGRISGKLPRLSPAHPPTDHPAPGDELPAG